MTQNEPSPKSGRGTARELIIGIAVGVAVFLVTGLGTRLLGFLAQAQTPIWWYVIALVAVSLIASATYRPWRQGLWGNVAKWRPLTTGATLERIREEGRNEVRAEFDTKKHKPHVRAQWMVAPNDEKEFSWFLANVAQGSSATHVSLITSVDFLAGSALDWEEIHGDDRVNFIGQITQGGWDYGLKARVDWTDVFGERQSSSVTLTDS